jgi:predicted metal-dependent hydrolase
MKSSVALVQYGSESIEYEVVSSRGRRTLGIEVHPDLGVIVRAPINCDAATVAARVRRRSKWISKQIEHFRRFRPRTPPRCYVPGETHKYLGRQYRLRLIEGELTEVKLLQGQIIVSSPKQLEPRDVKNLLQGWFRGRAKEVYASVLQDCSSRFRAGDFASVRLSVRSMQTRWGSMSSAKLMTLNVNLVHAPRNCIEYVVMHELCHLVHPHHGPAFLRLMTRMMPDWEARKRKLDETML